MDNFRHTIISDFIDYIRQEGTHPELEIAYIDLLDETTPETFLFGTGTGAFVPTEFEVDVQSKIRANPDYFREGLPLIEGCLLYTSDAADE